MSDRWHNAQAREEWKELASTSEEKQTASLFLSEFPLFCKLVSCSVNRSTLRAVFFQLPERGCGCTTGDVWKQGKIGKRWKSSSSLFVWALQMLGWIMAVIHITLWCNHRQYKWKLPPALSNRSLSWQIWAEIKHKIVCWVSQGCWDSATTDIMSQSQ